jgi:hypothetical protein
MTEPNFKAFSKILAFMNQLKDCFGNEFPEIVKYYSLVKKTGIDRTELICKHVDLFAGFCDQNKDAIKTGNMKNLSGDPIIFNDKIKFCLKSVVAKANTLECETIAKHLQLISCLIHTDEEMKTALMAATPATPAAGSGLTKEEAFFESLIGNLEQKYEGQDVNNVGQVISDLKGNGFLDQMSAKLESGDLDPQNVLKGAQKMFDKIKGQTTDPALMGMMNMVQSLMNQATSGMN